MSFEFSLDGLAMKQTDETLVGDWNKYPAQIRASQLLNREGDYSDIGDQVIAMNCSPTGGGKTFSWKDPAIRRRDNVLVMCPTKALTSDQKQAAEKHIEEEYDSSDDIAVLEFTQDTFDDYRAEMNNPPSSNGATFARLIERYEEEYESIIAFTNPDIFSNIRNNVYDNSSGSFARLASGVFDVVVVDEFHHARMKGRHSLITLLNDMIQEDESVSETHTGFLLSATPDKNVRSILENIRPHFEEIRKDGDQKPWSEVPNNKKGDDWMSILPPAKIDMRKGNRFRVGHTLSDGEELDELEAFCTAENRTAILLDSRKEVRSMYDALSRRLDDYEVRSIDGHSEKPEDLAEWFNNPSTKTVLIGNATLEVGVNLKPDQMLLTALSPSKMVQRIGRLRSEDRQSPTTKKLRVYVPEQKAFDMFSSMEGKLLQRETFESLVQEAYSEIQEPISFVPAFASFEAWKQTQEKIENAPTEREDEIYQEALGRVRRQFYEPFGVEFDEERFLQRYDEYKHLVDEFKSYRSSSLETLVYNTAADRVETQSIPDVLRTGDVDIVEKDEFYESLSESQKKTANNKEPYSYGYVIFHGQHDLPNSQASRTVKIRKDSTIRGMLMKEQRDRKPERMTSVQLYVDEDELPPVDVRPLNRALEEANPVVYPVEADTYSASFRFGLDPFFFLTEVADDNETISVAFSHKAFELYCIMQEILTNDYASNELPIPVGTEPSTYDVIS